MISGEARVGGYLSGISQNILESMLESWCFHHHDEAKKGASVNKLHSLKSFLQSSGWVNFNGLPNRSPSWGWPFLPFFRGVFIHPWWFCWPDVWTINSMTPYKNTRKSPPKRSGACDADGDFTSFAGIILGAGESDEFWEIGLFWSH